MENIIETNDNIEVGKTKIYKSKPSSNRKKIVTAILSLTFASTLAAGGIIGYQLYNDPEFMPSDRTPESYAILIDEKVLEAGNFTVSYPQIENLLRKEYPNDKNSDFMPFVFSDSFIQFAEGKTEKNKIRNKYVNVEGETAQLIYSFKTMDYSSFPNMKRMEALDYLEIENYETALSQHMLANHNIVIDLYKCGLFKWCMEGYTSENDSNIKKDIQEEIISKSYMPYWDYINEATNDFDTTFYEKEDIQNFYYFYSVTPSDSDLETAYLMLNNYEMTESELENIILNLAKRKYPAIANSIEAGYQIDDWMYWHRAVYAEVFEVSMNTVSFYTSGALQDYAMSSTPMNTEYDFSRYLRGTDEYWSSPKAINEMAELARYIGQSFGKVPW